MKSNKKAFTIVELVIVIAVIAILAAVLIPTFSNMIKRSKVSADQQLIRNLNSALKADLKDHNTMTDALAAAEEFGYDVSKINKSATDNEILWDSKNDAFCYFESDKNQITYIPGTDKTVDSVDAVDYWVIAKAPSDKYSTYLYGYEGAGELTITKGLDVGKETSITKVSYVRTTGATQNVKIRTNGGELIVNAPNDNVYHYGDADSVNIIAVASTSYHENGTVPFIQISKGRIEIEATADVNGIHIANVQTMDANFSITRNTEEFSHDVTVTLNGKEVKLSRDKIGTNLSSAVLVCKVEATAGASEYIWLFGNGTIEDAKVYVTNSTIAPDTTEGSDVNLTNASKAAIAIANNLTNTGTEQAPVWTASDSGKTAEEAEAASALKGSGTQENPYLIYNLKDFQGCQALTENSTSVVYFKVMEDFTDTDANWCTFLYYADVDLNGHTITLATAHTFTKFINDVKVHNGTVHWDGGSSFCNLDWDENANVKATFENLNLTGKIITNSTHFGPITSYLYAASYKGTYEINANNINNTLTIIDQNGDVGGLFGYIQGSKITASVTNCTFAGSIQGSAAGGFFNCTSYPEAKPIVNNGNSVTGKLIASGSVRPFGLNGNYDPVKPDSTKDSLTAQNALVDSVSGSLITLTESTSLLAIDSTSKEISISSVDGASYYIVEIEYWVNRNADGSGGYPRTIQVRLDNAGNSGLKQLDFVQADTEPNASVQLLDFDAAKVWEENGAYKIYDPYYTMYHSSSNWYVRAYAFDANDTLKAFQTAKR